MDSRIEEKKLFQAVAGSGKTRKIIEDTNLDSRIAIITYTINNQEVIKKRLEKKYGEIPKNIHIFGLFEFLYSFCLQPNISLKLDGIIFSASKFHKATNNKYKYKNKYKHKNKKIAYFYKHQIFDNMLSKFLVENKHDINYLERIRKYFDIIYIDEVQDFAGDEIDWLNTLLEINELKIWLLGDFFQGTFSTTNRGNKGSRAKKSYLDWVKAIEGYKLDDFSLNESKRCNEKVCKFIRKNLEIEIRSSISSNEESIIFVEDNLEIDKITTDKAIKKLFYKKHYNYNCSSDNWGSSKGCEFDNICVVLNKKTAEFYKKDKLNELPLQTKSRLYIACTRTKNKIYFIEESKLKKYKK